MRMFLITAKYALNGDNMNKNEVIEKLKSVIDPELGINIVDLGLIYNVEIDDKEIKILMTLTTPSCPLAPYFEEKIEKCLKEFGKKISIEFTFSPLWSFDKMSENAKLLLGIY